MLDILRKNSQSFVIQAVVVIIAVVFIFWGIGSNLGHNPNSLASVNGTDLTYMDFQKRYDQIIKNYRDQGIDLSQDALEKSGLRDQVLSQLIGAELLRQSADATGIVASDQAVQKKVYSIPVFAQSGGFDMDLYKFYLSRNNLSPKKFENSIRTELQVERLYRAMDYFATLPRQELQHWLEYLTEEIKLTYTSFNSADYLAQATVSDEELSNWYASNQQRYQTPPERKLQYLFFALVEDSTKAKAAITDADIEKYYQEHLTNYQTPEQRRARHILFAVKEGETPQRRAEQEARAEKVLAELKTGKDFAALAAQYSDDASKNNGGDLGFFSRGAMVEPFEEAVFNMQPGQISELVVTPFGYHIIQLESIQAPQNRPIAEVSDAIRQAIVAQQGKAAVKNQASIAYEGIIRAGSLAKYSSEKGVTIAETDFFTQNNPPAVPVLTDPNLLQTIFALGKGELSSLVETPKGYAIIFVTDAKESTVPELSAVREQALAGCKQDKAMAMAKAAADALLAQLQEGKPWPAGQKKDETGYMQRTAPAPGVPDGLQRNAFSRLGDALLNGTMAAGDHFYVYQVVDQRQQPDSIPPELRQVLSQQLQAQQREQLLDEWINMLRNQASIRVNQAMLR